MMTLLGELEFNERHYHVDGYKTFLFVGTNPQGETVYALSPSETHYHVGDITVFKQHKTLYEFFKWYVSMDEKLGRGVYKSLANCKMRLKGFQEWTERNKGNYVTPIVLDEWLDLMTIEDFTDFAKHGASNNDGHGHPVKNDMEDHNIYLYPSTWHIEIPADATHVSWYNK